MSAGAYVHPCFLYESVWCLLGFIFLHIYSKKLRTFDGEVALLYLAWYGFGRTFIEQLRTDSLYAGPFKVSQLVGIVSFAAAMICFVIMKVRTHKTKKPLYVNSGESNELIMSDLKAEEDRKAKKRKKSGNEVSDNAEENEASEKDKAEEAEESSEEKDLEEKPEDKKETEDKEKDDGGKDN